MAKMYIVNTPIFNTTDISGYEYTVADIPLAMYGGSTYTWPDTMASELLPYGHSLFIATKENQSISNMTDFFSIHWTDSQWVILFWVKDGEVVYNSSYIPHDPWTIVYDESTGGYGFAGYLIRDGKYVRYIPKTTSSEYIANVYDFIEALTPAYLNPNPTAMLMGYMEGQAIRK